jgi:hypothetical protein
LGAVIEWSSGGLNGGNERQTEENKEGNLRRRRRRRGIRQDSAWPEGHRPDLSISSGGVELFSIESEVDARGVTDPNDDLFPSCGGALAAGGQKLRFDGLAISSDRNPGFVAGVDGYGKFTRSGGGGGRSSRSRAILGRSRAGRTGAPTRAGQFFARLFARQGFA